MTYLNLNDRADGYTITGTALDVKDLACPTWGVGRRTAADGAVITTVGPPYLPLIMPASQAWSLEPASSSACTGLLDNPFGLNQFQVYDPPIVLTAAAGLVSGVGSVPTSTPQTVHADPTTKADPQAIRSTDPAEPASPLALAPPLQTDPGSPIADPGPSTVDAKPADPIGDPHGPAASPADPSVDPDTNTSGDLVTSAAAGAQLAALNV